MASRLSIGSTGVTKFSTAHSPMKALIWCSIGGARTASSRLNRASPRIPINRPLSFGNTSHLRLPNGAARIAFTVSSSPARPALKTGAEIENPHLIDLAPTILHLLGVSVPEDMDGSVLIECLPARVPRGTSCASRALPLAPQKTIARAATPTKSRPKSRSACKLSATSSNSPN